MAVSSPNAQNGVRDIASLLIMIGIFRAFRGAFLPNGFLRGFFVELIFDLEVVQRFPGLRLVLLVR